MIEIGKNSDMPNVSGAVMFHSTETGRFMAAGRQETLEFLAAVKAGEFDDLFFGPPEGASAVEFKPVRPLFEERRP